MLQATDTIEFHFIKKNSISNGIKSSGVAMGDQGAKNPFKLFFSSFARKYDALSEILHSQNVEICFLIKSVSSVNFSHRLFAMCVNVAVARNTESHHMFDEFLNKH